MPLATILSLLVSAGATIHTESPGVAVRSAPLQGLPLVVWNDSSLFNLLKPGMRERGDRVFRFPNGSYSDIYHWNKRGTYSPDSVWMADSVNYTPGWAAQSNHRGITTSSAYSLIDDGDTSTFWWSNSDNPGTPGWFIMDLGAAKSVDSLALWLGSVQPDSVQILRWSGTNGIYPSPYEQADGTPWTQVARLPASAFVGFKLPAVSSIEYLAVRPIDPTPNGWQVGEFKALKSGAAVSVNTPNGTTQSAIFAMSTHPSSRPVTFNSDWDFETYMAWIQQYPDAEPMICVNYGTGTEQEAAAWVHYANVVKGYGIKRWQIGNEMSGQWEEGGCVSARQYAERFVKFAKAMKAEDPSISIEGPVLASSDFVGLASGDYDGRSWMEGFLYYVDTAEAAYGKRLLDGVDFHNYPYWFSTTPAVGAMITSCDGNGAQYDSLLAVMGRTISNPTSREVLMTEYNTSTVSSSLEMQASAGTAAGLQFAHFIQRFGDRGVTNLWELYEGGGVGPDGTYGSLSAFVKPTLGEWSSLGYAPNASFWTTRTILRQWLDTAGGDVVLPIDQVAGARMFAVSNADRISVLAFNLDADSTPISLDPTAFPNGGDILSWGTGEYNWIGTTATARAIPNNGPSSTSFTTLGTVKIPPYGMLVVRGAGRAKQAPHTAHWLLSSATATTSDTLVVAGWTTGEGVKLRGGTWSTGAASGTLTATDGAWDGPSESWTAKIPASALGVGNWNVKVSIADNSGDVAVDSTPVQVSGTLRPVLLIANFDNKRPLTAHGATWWPFSADNGTVSVTYPARPGASGYFMRDTIVLTQPSNLTYTNYGTGFSDTTLGMHALDSTYGLAGIVFDVATSHTSASGTFAVSVNLTSVKDYDDYAIPVPNTKGAWVTDTVLFSNLHQGGWGAAVPFQVDSINGLTFSGSVAGTISISLDNIYFLGTQGQGINAVTPRVSAPKPLALLGRNLTIGVSGPWVLRLVSPDGRVSHRWTGTGVGTLELPRSPATEWAILESAGLRRTLAIPILAR